MKVSIRGRSTKISMDIRKTHVSTITIRALDKVVQVAILVKNKIKCNVSVETIRSIILKVTYFEAQAKMKNPLLQSKNVCIHLKFAKEHKN